MEFVAPKLRTSSGVVSCIEDLTHEVYLQVLEFEVEGCRPQCAVSLRTDTIGLSFLVKTHAEVLGVRNMDGEIHFALTVGHL